MARLALPSLLLILACGSEAKAPRPVQDATPPSIIPAATRFELPPPPRATPPRAEQPRGPGRPSAQPPPGPDVVTAPGAQAPDGTGAIAFGSGAALLTLQLARDVQSRRPVDPGERFAAGTRVNLFIEASNRGPDPTRIQVAWERSDTGWCTNPTTVNIARRKMYRTRAYQTLRRPGEYRCIVMDEDGEELAAIPFTIEPGED